MFKKIKEKRDKKRFEKQYKKACDIADLGAKESKKKHCVVLTQDDKFVVVDKSGVKRINEIRRKSKMLPTTWQEILKKATYTAVYISK